jgi:D-cysteine desulfhydrase
MRLAKFPIQRRNGIQSPIEFRARFPDALDGVNVCIKRDDLLGLTSTGNKTRTPEPLVSDALLQSATTWVTGGVVQSNLCHLIFAVAVTSASTSCSGGSGWKKSRSLRSVPVGWWR